jgi:rubrerythrin
MRVPFLESTPESAPKPTTEPAPEKPQKPAKAKQNNRASDKPQKLVAFTLRVDESIDNGLKILCNNERITKETFLEAAYLASQENAQIKQHILEIAKDRRQKRRETGVLRRAKSMSKYLG